MQKKSIYFQKVSSFSAQHFTNTHANNFLNDETSKTHTAEKMNAD